MRNCIKELHTAWSWRFHLFSVSDQKVSSGLGLETHLLYQSVATAFSFLPQHQAFSSPLLIVLWFLCPSLSRAVLESQLVALMFFKKLLLLFKFLILFLLMCICLCDYMLGGGYPEVKESTESTRARVTGSYELLWTAQHWNWQSNSGPLGEQQVHFITKPSLHPSSDAQEPRVSVPVPFLPPGQICQARPAHLSLSEINKASFPLSEWQENLTLLSLYWKRILPLYSNNWFCFP